MSETGERIEAELNERDMVVGVAATMAVVLGYRFNADDAAMNDACARAVALYINARAGDAESAVVVLDAMERLHNVVRTILTESAAVTARPH